ncbi:translation initiation factor IF-2, partial [Streptomyces sp. 2MCAF27]
MRRLLLLAPLLLFAVGCGVVPSSEDEATDAAREVARKAGERLYGQRPRTAEEVGRSASVIDGVEVLRVTGTSTHDGDGVDVVVRTSGSAYNGWDSEEVDVRRCFAVRVSPKSEWDEDPRDVDCP